MVAVEEKLRKNGVDTTQVRQNLRFSAAYCMKKLGSQSDDASVALCRLSQVGRTRVNPAVSLSMEEYTDVTSARASGVMSLLNTVLEQAQSEGEVTL